MAFSGLLLAHQHLTCKVILYPEPDQRLATMKVLELRDIIRNATSPQDDLDQQDWDPYSSSTSFYGPGAFLCWLFVACSYALKCRMAWKSHD
jgi:hypothetical protein